MAGRHGVKRSDSRRMGRTACYLQQFEVPYVYPVYFTRNLFARANPVLAGVLRQAGLNSRRRMLVYVDDGAAAADRRLIPALEASLARCPDVCELVRPPETIPGGERTKNGWSVVQSIMATIGAARLDRHSFVVAIGGGSVLDMVGFAASLVHRGIRLIRVPTTVLAQCDAGVGVKNGMNENGTKNFVGTFAPPFAVLVDFRFLRTLPPKYWTGGIAEAFKIALIKDARLFAYLCRHAGRLRRRDAQAIEHVVKRTAILHLEHIRLGGDPFETGSARPLDFGHWAAHKLEVLSHYSLAHGQAVAIGIALDSCYAAVKGFITAAQRDRIIRALAAVGLPVWDGLLEEDVRDGAPALLDGLEDFREHLGGRLTLTMPRGIGCGVEIHDVDMAAMKECIRRLKEADDEMKGGPV
jgi:3-dehydroquinate synthase